MKRSSMPGIKPLVSNRLAAWLQTSDEQVLVYDDPVDELIAEEGLTIARFVHFRGLDLFLLILSNRRVISRLLSEYSALGQASDAQLVNHTITEAGIHCYRRGLKSAGLLTGRSNAVTA